MGTETSGADSDNPRLSARACADAADADITAAGTGTGTAETLVDVESLAGIPIRPIEWIFAPAVSLILGIAGIFFASSASATEPGFLRWVVLGGAIILIAIAVALGWFGYAAYSRMTAADAKRYRTAGLIAAFAGGVTFIVVGAGSAVQTGAGVGILITLVFTFQASGSSPSGSWSSDRLLLVGRLVLMLNSVLFASGAVLLVLALTDASLPGRITSAYFGKGLVDLTVAIIAITVAVMRLRRIRSRAQA